MEKEVLEETGSKFHKENFPLMVASIRLYVAICFHPAALLFFLISSFFSIPFTFCLVCLLDLGLFLALCLGPPSQRISTSLTVSFSLGLSFPLLCPHTPSIPSSLPTPSSPGPGVWVWVEERPPGPEEAAGGGPKPSLHICICMSSAHPPAARRRGLWEVERGRASRELLSIKTACLDRRPRTAEERSLQPGGPSSLAVPQLRVPIPPPRPSHHWCGGLRLEE